MALPAETLAELGESFYQPTIELVVVVPELQEDELIRYRAAKFIGNCAVDESVNLQREVSIEKSTVNSLYDAIQKAAEGDPVARNMLTANTGTDVIERTVKAGHVMEVELDVDDDGTIWQHGQSSESIQANSLRYASDIPQMRERTETETVNAFRIKQLYKQGKLNDYSFVVFSRASDNMTLKEMTDAGFFTDTMSCAIQVTTAKSGKLTTETAFVAGVKNPGEDRHDGETLIAVGDELDVDFRDLTATESIGQAVLVHNSLIPNGVVDLVKIWDKPNGTFFGQERPVEDYTEYLQKCKDREAQLQPKVDSIVKQLIAEAPGIKNQVQAINRLSKISEQHMVEQAVFDEDINPLVFGRVAANHILEARIQFELGNNALAFNAVAKAKDTARSSCCPSGLRRSDGLEDSNETSETKDIEYISKECPICHEKNVKTKAHITKTGKLIISGDCGCAVVK